eukprot:15439551-Alexandrium_andersonii.AAC.1
MHRAAWPLTSNGATLHTSTESSPLHVWKLRDRCNFRDRVRMLMVVTAISRGPFCAVVRAEREYGNDNLPGARLGLVLDGFSSRTWTW